MSFTTSIITGGSNNHETTSTEANAVATDFFSEGVVGAFTNTSGVAPATGSFAVNAQGTPNMTVAVSPGTAYTTATPTGQSSQLLRTVSSATENVTIAANSTGSTRYDWVYLKIDPDNAADSDASASNVASLVTSRSTSSSSDDGTPPTYGTLLAVVTVANGASSITNGNISDERSNATVGTNQLADASVTSAKVDFGGAGAGIWWEEIGRTTLGSAGDTITVSSLPARKHLKVKILTIATGGTSDARLRFDNDSGANYSQTTANLAAGGAQATNTSTNQLLLENGNPASGAVLYGELRAINIATQPKIVFWENAHSVASAGTAPTISLAWGKWSNTSDAISRIDVTNHGTGDFAVGSEVIVLGHD